VSESNQVARPTQSFVGTMTWVRKHPKLVLLEVLWRWIVGIPALVYSWHLVTRVMATTPWRETGIAELSINKLLTDPMAGSNVIASALLVVWPALKPALMVAVPIFVVAWVIVASMGRTLVLRAMDRTAMRARPLTLIVLNLLRALAMVATAWVWWSVLSYVAKGTILEPSMAGGEPQVMVYVGAAIVLTIGLFMLWAIFGWVFGIAPLLAMLRNIGAWQSLRAAMRLGKLRGRLIEINLVMGVVKIALLVLLMVFSATPLPFQSVATEDFLLKWTLGVGVLYFIASDYFHVTRLAAYLQLWQAEEISK